MYELRLTDTPEHLLACVHDLDEIEEVVEDLLHDTWGQLEANGEGVRDFVLRLSVYDDDGQHVDEIAARTSISPRG